MAIFSVLFLSSAFIYIYLALTAITSDRKNPINRLFFIIALMMVSWAIISTLMINSTKIEDAVMYRSLATFAWSLLYALLLHYFLIITNKDNKIKNPIFFIPIYLPAAFSIFLYYFYEPSTAAEIIKTKFGWAFINTVKRGFLWDYYYLIYYLVFLTISIVILKKWGKNSGLKREKKQAKIIIYTMIIALILGTITDFILPMTKVSTLPPLGVLVCIIPIGAIWYSVKKYKFMTLNYESLTIEILKLIDEGLIITDHNNIISSVNIGALSLLGFSEPKELIGKDIEYLYHEDTSLNNAIYKNKEVYLKTRTNNKIPALLQSLMLRDSLGDPYGTLYSFQDLSEIKEAQDKLRSAYDQLEFKVSERTFELKKANDTLLNEVIARTKAEEKIHEFAYFDPLTNLPNRRLFTDRLQQSILNAERNNEYIAVLYLDIDYFKIVNDTLGHTKGDMLLMEVGKRLASTLRRTDTICRLGGDEFVIILKELQDPGYIQAVSQKLIKAIREPFILDNKEMFITASVGIATYPVDGQDTDSLLKNADLAMYRAKDLGKNRVEFCNIELKEKINIEMRLTNDLYHALEKNQLELYYQPQIDSYTNSLVGLEALIRWNHPELGLVSPANFIPVAERSGLILPIGEWVMETACKQNRIWYDKKVLDVQVAVNVSLKQLQMSELTKTFINILDKTSMDPSKLELEITENIFMRDLNLLLDTLHSLKALGLKLAIDDFGTEYASLSYLKQLPVDRLKIAMTFIQGITHNSKDKYITESIILLAKNIGLEIIAEGAETIEQVEFLKKVGCNTIQGYYYYRPMPKEELEKIFG